MSFLRNAKANHQKQETFTIEQRETGHNSQGNERSIINRPATPNRQNQPERGFDVSHVSSSSSVTQSMSTERSSGHELNHRHPHIPPSTPGVDRHPHIPPSTPGVDTRIDIIEEVREGEEDPVENPVHNPGENPEAG
ncbi:Hypothetical predicted protein [Olea europaea subsp. europaea]|uniref:Uncharacterized protein n=1 Tax=Olea europaea subsp. europaea TaxID=158383 RepID=A0A8S0PWQ5_OLEEU|nr:Hypothetical predicted protein [Olea europaea subsp. europaea]